LHFNNQKGGIAMAGMAEARQAAETGTSQQNLFRIFSFRVDDCGYGDNLEGSSRVNMSILIPDSKDHAGVIIEEADTMAEAIFKVFKTALSPLYPELNNIRLVRSDKGMEYQAGELKWPIESVSNGSLNAIIMAMEKTLNKAIAELRENR
jgi:hypothetical protein